MGPNDGLADKRTEKPWCLCAVKCESALKKKNEELRGWRDGSVSKVLVVQA